MKQMVNRILEDFSESIVSFIPFLSPRIQLDIVGLKNNYRVNAVNWNTSHHAIPTPTPNAMQLF